jgi:hypothetical protein
MVGRDSASERDIGAHPAEVRTLGQHDEVILLRIQFRIEAPRRIVPSFYTDRFIANTSIVW